MRSPQVIQQAVEALRNEYQRLVDDANHSSSPDEYDFFLTERGIVALPLRTLEWALGGNPDVPDWLRPYLGESCADDNGSMFAGN